MVSRIARAATALVITYGSVFAGAGALAVGRAQAVVDGPGSASVEYALPSASTDGAGSSSPVSHASPVNLTTGGSESDLRVQAWGDLRTATAIALLVPGVGHTASEFDNDPQKPASLTPMTLPDRARALRAEAQDPNLAVIAWLGYHPPPTSPAALGSNPIRTGAANLLALDAFLAEVNPRARITWICHSYGSLVCASALHAPDHATHPDAVALVGSPGVQVGQASDLPTDAEIWAGQGDDDSISLTGLLGFAGGGFGPNPANPSFGTHPIACDEHTGHSDYFRPGSAQLRALAQIAKGSTNARFRSPS